MRGGDAGRQADQSFQCTIGNPATGARKVELDSLERLARQLAIMNMGVGAQIGPEGRSGSKDSLMKDLEPHSGSQFALPVDDHWLLARRIAQSQTFHRSPRLREFLLFVVERTLAGRSSELCEYEIGVQALGRPPRFDPSEDSAVRSLARQLRAKLHEYFEGEGQSEPILLDIPKGGYVPEFVPRGTPTSAIAPATPAGPGWRQRAVVVGAIAFACLAIVWFVTRSPARTWFAQELQRPNPTSLASCAFTGSGSDVNVVMADAALVLVNSYRKNILTLDEYLRFADQQPLPLPQARADGASREFPGHRLFTVFQNAAFAMNLAKLGGRQGWSVKLRHPRLLQARDFREGNFVVLGNPWSTPWVYLFEDQLNFRFSEAPDGGVWELKNTAPQAGEKAVYWSPPAESRNGVSYARLAVLPNLTRTGVVVLISGLQPESTEAGGDAILSPEFFTTVLQITGGSKLSDITGLEMMLEVTAVDGTVQGTKVVASRVPKR
jgi:hypothetical protein